MTPRCVLRNAQSNFKAIELLFQSTLGMKLYISSMRDFPLKATNNKAFSLHDTEIGKASLLQLQTGELGLHWFS